MSSFVTPASHVPFNEKTQRRLARFAQPKVMISDCCCCCCCSCSRFSVSVSVSDSCYSFRIVSTLFSFFFLFLFFHRFSLCFSLPPSRTLIITIENRRRHKCHNFSTCCSTSHQTLELIPQFFHLLHSRFPRLLKFSGGLRCVPSYIHTYLYICSYVSLVSK